MFYDAALRNLQTLSEATQQMPDELKAASPDIPWREISSFRNILVHNYLGDIDPNTVAAVVGKHLIPWQRPSDLCWTRQPPRLNQAGSLVRQDHQGCLDAEPSLCGDWNHHVDIRGCPLVAVRGLRIATHRQAVGALFIERAQQLLEAFMRCWSAVLK